MNGLENRVKKLEKELLPKDDDTVIIIRRFVSPQGQEPEEGTRSPYPPIDEQIAEQQAAGKKVIRVYEYAGEV